MNGKKIFIDYRKGKEKKEKSFTAVLFSLQLPITKRKTVLKQYGY